MGFEIALVAAVALAVIVGVPRLMRRGATARAAAADTATRRRQARTATAKATVKQIERTGLSINDVPQYALELAVDLPDRVVTLTTKRLLDPVTSPRLAPGAELAVRYDPNDVENMVTELDAEFAPPEGGADATGGSTSGTGASFDAPMWCFGQHEPDRWLVPPRAAGATPLVVIVMTDPHHAARDAHATALVELANAILADALWMTTDLPTSAAAMVQIETRKLVKLTGELLAYDAFVPYLQNLDPRPIAVWGAARRDLATEGLTIKIRRPDRDAERTLTAPLPDLADFVIGWLVGEGLCQRVTPPTWYRAPTGEALALYAHLLHNLHIQILADVRNGALAPLDPAQHESYADLANDIGEAHDNAVMQLAALATSLYAERAGHLSPKQRDRALAIVARHGGDHPVHRLSPLYLRAFGRAAEADARAAALGGEPAAGAFRDAADPYRAWLDRVATAASR